MSLPRRLPSAEPDPALLALFEQPEHIPLAVRRQADFFVFFARTIFPLLESYRDRRNPIYCVDNGRPAWDPVRFLGVLVLQFVLRLPDRQAAEAAQFDQRWRLALHLEAQDATFDPSLLVVFRNRLVEHEAEGLAFMAVLDYLVEHGWVPKRSKQRLDSTHVRGLLSIMNRLECARETIRLLLVDVEAGGCLPSSWDSYWDRYVESKVDPRAKAPALEEKAAQAGEDMLAIWKDAAGSRYIFERDSFVLLQRVFLENYTVDAAGRAHQTRTQPTGAVHNPHEPEAQWSSKSTTKDKSWVGYKAQVAETVQDEPRQPHEPTANFLTAIVTQNAPASDKPGMTEVLAEQHAMGLDAPATLYVDGAYVCSEALNDAREQAGNCAAPPRRRRTAARSSPWKHSTCMSRSGTRSVPPSNAVVTAVAWKSRARARLISESNGARRFARPARSKRNASAPARIIAPSWWANYIRSCRIGDGKCRPISSSRRCIGATASKARRANWSEAMVCARLAIVAKLKSGCRTIS